MPKRCAACGQDNIFNASRCVSCGAGWVNSWPAVPAPDAIGCPAPTIVRPRRTRPRSVAGVVGPIVAVVLLCVIAATVLVVALSDEGNSAAGADGSDVARPTASTVPAVSVPAWASAGTVHGPDGRSIHVPSDEAMTKVCAGEGLPGWLNLQARSGPRTIAYWYDPGNDRGYTGVRSGGTVPGPDNPGSGNASSLSERGAIGWVLCLTQVSQETAECGPYLWGTDPSQFILRWRVNESWTADLREAHSGRSIGTRAFHDSSECPDEWYGTREGPEQRDLSPGNEELDQFVHEHLG